MPKIQYKYDELGRLIEVTDESEENKSTLEHDSAGNITSVVAQGTLVNATPAITVGTPHRVWENQNFQTTVIATDDDGTVFGYFWQQIDDNPLVPISNPYSRTLAFFSPSVEEDTEYQFSVLVADNLGAISTEVVTVVVQNVSQAPIIHCSYDNYANEGETVNLSCEVTDDNDITSYVWSSDNSEVVFSDPSSPVTSFVAPDVSRDTVASFTLTATDSDNLTSEETFTITIRYIDEDPVIVCEPTETFDERTEAHATCNATDDSGFVQYYWQYNGEYDIWLEDSNQPTVRFIAPEVTSDTSIVLNLTVAGGGDDASYESVSVNIKDVSNNAPPVVSCDTPQSHVELRKVKTSCTATDDKEGVTYQWSYDGGYDIQLRNADTGTVTFYAPEVEQNENIVIQFTATDSDNVQTIQEVIIPVEHQNARPGLSCEPEKAVWEESDVTITCIGQDKEGEVTYSWQQTGVTDVSYTGGRTHTVSFTAPEINDDTPVIFRVAVIDSESADAKARYELTVLDRKAPPTISCEGNNIVAVDDVITVNIVSDNSSFAQRSDNEIYCVRENWGETDPFQYSWDGLDETNISVLASSKEQLSLQLPEDYDAESLSFSYSLVNNDNETTSSPITINVKQNTYDHAPILNCGDDVSVIENNNVNLQCAFEDKESPRVFTYWYLNFDEELVNVGSNADNIQFTAPQVEQNSTYTLSVIARDDSKQLTKDTMKVTVLNQSNDYGVTCEENFQVEEGQAAEIVIRSDYRFEPDSSDALLECNILGIREGIRNHSWENLSQVHVNYESSARVLSFVSPEVNGIEILSFRYQATDHFNETIYWDISIQVVEQTQTGNKQAMNNTGNIDSQTLISTGDFTNHLVVQESPITSYLDGDMLYGGSINFTVLVGMCLAIGISKIRARKN